MDNIISILYPLIWVLMFYLTVRKNTLVKLDNIKLALAIVYFSILILWVISFVTRFKLLNPIYIGKNGFTISFLGIALLLILSMIVGCIVESFKKKIK